MTNDELNKTTPPPLVVRSFSEGGTILDIGTGSSCIAIWLKTQWPQANITAIDISKKALKIAQKNARRHEANITYVHGSLLSALDPKSHYDLIVANLPYVPEAMPVSREVSQEPDLALFSGSDGLDLIRKLAQEIKTKSIEFDQLWLEFLPEQITAIEEIFADYRVTRHEDIGGSVFFAKIEPK